MSDSPTPTPNPVNRTNLSRAGIAGAILGVLAIVLFVVIWVVLGSMNVAVFARLMLALCLPPAIIAAMVGAYYVLVARPRM